IQLIDGIKDCRGRRRFGRLFCRSFSGFFAFLKSLDVVPCILPSRLSINLCLDIATLLGSDIFAFGGRCLLLCGNKRVRDSYHFGLPCFLLSLICCPPRLIPLTDGYLHALMVFSRLLRLDLFSLFCVLNLLKQRRPTILWLRLGTRDLWFSLLLLF